VNLNPSIDLRVAERFWKEQVEPFDWEHANRVSGMAETVARTLGADQRLCIMARACGIFHDVQRKGNFWEKDIHHAARGAQVAETVLRANGWDAAAIRDVTRTIAQHYLSGPLPNKQDILACALWDADILDSARHPDEEMWLARYKRRMSVWARDPENAGSAVIKAQGRNEVFKAQVIERFKKRS